MMSTNTTDATQTSSEFTLHNPRIPLWCRLPSLEIGDLLICTGHIPTKAHRFDLNLQKDCGNGKTFDTLLHIKVNLDKRQVCGNVHLGGRWGRETRSGYLKSLHLGHPFTCLVYVKKHYFKVGLNGEHLFDHNHHVPVCAVDTLCIEGSVDVVLFTLQKGVMHNSKSFSRIPRTPTLNSVVKKQVQFEDEIVDEEIKEVLTPSRGRLQSVLVDEILEYSPKLPFLRTVRKGMKDGSILFFTAKPAPLCQQFEIGLSEGTGMGTGYPAYALLIRFEYGVRIRVGPYSMGRWQEGSVTREWRRDMLVKVGQHFDMTIMCHQTQINGDQVAGSFKISVNNCYVASFAHSVQSLSTLKLVSVTGDVTLVHARLQK